MQLLACFSHRGGGWLEARSGAAQRFSGSLCGAAMTGGACMPGGTPLCQFRVGAFH